MRAMSSSSAPSSSSSRAVIEKLEARQLLAAPGQLVGGVDPYNMGKGDWIWQISSAMTATGSDTIVELAD